MHRIIGLLIAVAAVVCTDCVGRAPWFSRVALADGGQAAGVAGTKQPQHVVTQAEMAAVRQWTAAKFDGLQLPAKPEPGLVILKRGWAGNIEKNGFLHNAIWLGEARYQRGVTLRTNARIAVRLPGPGKRFSAVVGLEYNDSTPPGAAAFSVGIGGHEVARKVVPRGYGPGQPIEAGLNGAREFTIEVKDAEGHWFSDHASWGDAKVEMADGSEVWLGDMPIVKESESWPPDPPFSFTYGGRPSTGFLGAWKLERASKPLDSQRTGHTLTYSDPKTGLTVRCEAVAYRDFPVVEWTLHFKNAGPADTPIIEGIQALDVQLERTFQDEFALHHGAGCTLCPGDYQPFTTALKPKSDRRFAPFGGRATNDGWPYFNVEWPDQGVIVAVGWIGQWAARFTRDADRGLRVQAGQELTHFTLHPGEEVRSPLIAMLSYKGDWIRAQNLWRRWLLAHNAPRIQGKLPGPMMFGSSGAQTAEMDFATAANQIQFIDRYVEEHIRLDKWWMDAGWYSTQRQVGAWWGGVGTWTPDPARFPHGLREVSDYARQKGLGAILWFEPERVYRGSWLDKNHPEWLLRSDKPEKQNDRLLNLANAEARSWLTDYVSRLIVKEGIDVYRQDCNMDPLEYWRATTRRTAKGSRRYVISRVC